MQPEVMVVGGLFDNLLKSLIQMPDFAKADKPLLKTGVGNVLDSLKPTTNSLGGMVLDAAKTALLSIIDSWTLNAPALVVGASPEMMTEFAISGAKRKRSKADVEAAIIAEGGDVSKFSPFLLLLLQFAPGIIALIQKLLGK
jgi:hypothetical protein